MSTYVVLLPTDEDAWEQSSPEHRADVYAKHGEFAKALADRGHRVVGGAELAHSREAKQVRNDPAGGYAVTEGPYAEAVEQLSGFYIVESDDLDDLIDCCGILAATESAIEVRQMLTSDS